MAAPTTTYDGRRQSLAARGDTTNGPLQRTLSAPSLDLAGASEAEVSTSETPKKKHTVGSVAKEGVKQACLACGYVVGAAGATVCAPLIPIGAIKAGIGGCLACGFICGVAGTAYGGYVRTCTPVLSVTALMSDLCTRKGGIRGKAALARSARLDSECSLVVQ